MVGETGFEPATPSSRRAEYAIRMAWYRVTWLRIPWTTLGSEVAPESHALAPLPPVETPFGAFVVHDAVGQLLTVREVAARLRVSRATVYRLVQAGPCLLRISNSSPHSSADMGR